MCRTRVMSWTGAGAMLACQSGGRVEKRWGKGWVSGHVFQKCTQGETGAPPRRRLSPEGCMRGSGGAAVCCAFLRQTQTQARMRGHRQETSRDGILVGTRRGHRGAGGYAQGRRPPAGYRAAVKAAARKSWRAEAADRGEYRGWLGGGATWRTPAQQRAPAQYA